MEKWGIKDYKTRLSFFNEKVELFYGLHQVVANVGNISLDTLLIQHKMK
jgi:hypothetical protein